MLLCVELQITMRYMAVALFASINAITATLKCARRLKSELRSTRTYQNTPLHLDIPSPHVRLRPRTHRIACSARLARTARRCPPGCPLTPSTRMHARQWRMPLRTNEVLSEGSETDIRRWDAPSSILISDCAVTACFFPRFLTYGVKPSKSDRGFMFAQMVSVLQCANAKVKDTYPPCRAARSRSLRPPSGGLPGVRWR